ncbi:hypothetical protein JZ751_014447 [Albula glossodonta]|uniref:Uncharacterized protein n=1 Tax=Albula glossodonta TaxID=121402 RepID=A0A8T2MZ53_9TELE|nr:hypothetical protein JZ751_014447 [Albula glossodonta]
MSRTQSVAVGSASSSTNRTSSPASLATPSSGSTPRRPNRWRSARCSLTDTRIWRTHRWSLENRGPVCPSAARGSLAGDRPHGGDFLCLLYASGALTHQRMSPSKGVGSREPGGRLVGVGALRNVSRVSWESSCTHATTISSRSEGGTRSSVFQEGGREPK